MAEEIGSLVVRVGLDGSNFDKGMKNLNAQMNLAKSQTRALSGSFDKSGDAIKGLRTKQEGLVNQYKIQGQRVEELKGQYDGLVQAHGAESEAALRAGAKLNNAIGSYEQMGGQLQEVTKELTFQESKWGKATNSLEDFSQTMNRSGDKALKRGKSLTKGVTLPIAGIGLAALKTGADFEASMSKVQATSGATGSDFDALKDKAKQMGRDTQFSASESADALNYMALAGWKTEDMLNGLDGVMDLAAASGEDLAQTSDIVTDGLSAFKMEAKESGRMADVLAAASANANTDVAGMGAAFQYAAPVAGALGYSIEDTATAIGLMSNAGVKGQKAGTALRGMMTNLAKPTAAMKKEMDKLGISLTDSKGEMKPFGQITKDLRKSFSGLTEEQQASAAATIFGKESMSGALAVINASDEDYQKLEKSINGSEGAAKDMAKTMNDNAKGSLKELMSALEGLSIQMSEHLIPPATDLIKWLTKMARKFGDLEPETQKMVIGIAGIAAAIGPMNLLFGSSFKAAGKLAGGFASVTRRIGMAQAESRLASGALSTLGGAASTTGAGAAQSAGQFGKAAGSIGGMGKSAGLAKGAIAALGGPIGILTAVGLPAMVAGGVALVKQMRKETIPALDDFGGKVSKSTEKAYLGYKNLNDKATAKLNELFWSGKEITKEGTEELVGLFDQMGGQIAENMEKKFSASYKAMQDFFANSKDLSKKEQEEILNNMKEGHEKQKQEMKEGQDRIKTIMDTASKEKRKLTRYEQIEINEIQDRMNRNAIKSMSKSEKEQKTILETLKNESGKITARTAADTVKNSEKARKGAVKEANDKYDKTVSAIIKERDETGSISTKQADDLIKEAKRQRDDSVEQAEDMHTNVVKQAKEQAKGHVHEVNWTTGEVKTHWDTLVGQTADMVNDFSKAINWVLRHIGLEDKQIDPWKAGGRAKAAKKNAYGTGSHPGGDMILGDGRGFNAGRELGILPSGGMFLSAPSDTYYPDMPQGTEIVPAHQTKRIMEMVDTPKYAWGVGKKAKKIGKAIEDKVFAPVGEGMKATSEATQAMADKLWDVSGKKMLSLGLKAMNSFIPKADAGFTTATMLRGGFDFLKDKAANYLEEKRDAELPMMGAGLNFGKSFTRSSGYGPRAGGFHKGIDFAAPAGTPIRAQTGGTVIFSGRTPYGGGYGGYGNVVHVKGAGGLSYLYGHNSKNLVTTGQPISRGSVLGLVGSTGQSTGPHVHFEVRRNGKAINPESMISGGGGGGKLGSWVDAGMARAGVSGGAWKRGLTWIAQKESSGNPNAIGLNTSTGTAKGLMQLKDFNVQGNPFDPVNNIAGGVRYIQNRYGTIGKAVDFWKRNNWYATGGRISAAGMYGLAEGGYPEWIIPTDPARHDDAIKLLSHAAKDVGKNKRPNQLPNVSGGNDETVALLEEQNELLKQALSRKTDIYMDGRVVGGLVEPHITDKQQKDRRRAQRGRG